jgi:3-isopropylmalate/(R)-2-methylmalate dehydratase small subunit
MTRPAGVVTAVRARVAGAAVVVPGNDIDTDRIIPARFMKCVTFDGLGEHLFHDVRFEEDGSKKKHALNDPRFSGASILLSNGNFGCGSSREHAPQALAKSGFRAIVAESFAEIFFGNSTTLGIPCASVAPVDLIALSETIERDPKLELTVNLETSSVSVGPIRVPFTIKRGAREALMSGSWDPIGDLLDGAQAVKSITERLPYLSFQRVAG